MISVVLEVEVVLIWIHFLDFQEVVVVVIVEMVEIRAVGIHTRILLKMEMVLILLLRLHQMMGINEEAEDFLMMIFFPFPITDRINENQSHFNASINNKMMMISSLIY